MLYISYKAYEGRTNAISLFFRQKNKIVYIKKDKKLSYKTLFASLKKLNIGVGHPSLQGRKVDV